MDEKVEKLQELLEDAMTLYKEDRKLAKEHYKELREQLDNILEEEMEQSADGKLEKELGIAVKLVMSSGERLDKVIQTISTLVIQQLNAQNKKEVAGILVGKTPGGGIIDKPINMTELLEENKD